jgi:hypothetical protein
LRIAWPARPALLPADKGRMSAALTWPAPSVAPGAGCPPGGCGVEEKYGIEDKKFEFPEQPAKSALAAAIRPASERRRVGMMADP